MSPWYAGAPPGSVSVRNRQRSGAWPLTSIREGRRPRIASKGPPLFQLVIFDCDGVLVDSERIAVPIDVVVLARVLFS